MNVPSACLAIAIACALGPTPARAEATSVSLAASAAGVSSVVAVSVAGLSPASIQTLPGFPIKAYRDGYRYGRVVLGYRVSDNGTVRDVEVLEASPTQVFARTATNAVAGWRFAPTATNERRKVEFFFEAD